MACIDPEINPTMHSTETPTLLTQISSGIQHVALETPALWSAIHIPMIGGVLMGAKEEATMLVEKLMCSIKEWLFHQSGTVPLRISVWQVDIYFESANNLVDNLVETLLGCHKCWDNICLDILHLWPSLLSNLCVFTPQQVPHLHSFYI